VDRAGGEHEAVAGTKPPALPLDAERDLPRHHPDALVVIVRVGRVAGTRHHTSFLYSSGRPPSTCPLTELQRKVFLDDHLNRRVERSFSERTDDPGLMMIAVITNSTAQPRR